MKNRPFRRGLAWLGIGSAALVGVAIVAGLVYARLHTGSVPAGDRNQMIRAVEAATHSPAKATFCSTISGNEACMVTVRRLGSGKCQQWAVDFRHHRMAMKPRFLANC